MSEVPVATQISIDASQKVTILVVDGKGFRESVRAQLGKRLFCGLEVEIPRTIGVKTTGTGETTTPTRETRYVSGMVRSMDDKDIYLGCGMEVLCIKPSQDTVLCCNMPMIVKGPQVLPSAD